MKNFSLTNKNKLPDLTFFVTSIYPSNNAFATKKNKKFIIAISFCLLIISLLFLTNDSNADIGPATDVDNNIDAGNINLVKIAILAYRGNAEAFRNWQPTINYLQQSLPQYRFELVSLNLQQLSMNVETNRVDFVITNTGNYIELSHLYGISRIATLINKKQGATTSLFGAVIFTRADRNDINSLQDVFDKNVVAVNRNGFGGFYMARKEFLEHDIDIFEEAKNIDFTGFPQIKVLKSVLNGSADIGTFRTDSLEQLAENNNIDLSKIKLLNRKNNKNFPFLLSTALYPEWPISKLKKTNNILSQKIALALLSLTEDSHAATASKTAGWTIPLNYKPAYDLLKSLEVPPFDNSNSPRLIKTISQYNRNIFIILLILLVTAFILFYIYQLNIKLRANNKLLKSEYRNRTRLANRLEYMATHDVLTGLFNRRAFTDHLTTELNRANRYNRKFSLLLLDIDNFKIINDRFGHQTGDFILENVTQRITGLLRNTDLFCRIGGDEFVIINIDINTTQDIEILCERIHNALLAPHLYNDNKIKCSLSIGYAVYPDNGEDIKKLIKHADETMYTNKVLGKSIITEANKIISD